LKAKSVAFGLPTTSIGFVFGGALEKRQLQAGANLPTCDCSLLNLSDNKISLSKK
jgi:hypothetical protein